MSNFNSTFDNDFDSYLNLEPVDYTSTSESPAVKTYPSLAHQSSSSSSGAFLASTQPLFTGPSYQYDSHPQQTGLPSGALANTFAVNQQLGLQYRQTQLGFVMPIDTLNTQFRSTFDEFDFIPTQIDMADMDFDADSPSDMTAMYQNGSSGESSQSAPVQRMYPGMHRDQAAQAKAAQAQKQQENLRLQQQPKQIPGQRPLPTQAPKASAAKDPHVEESISRLLNRMRQSSSASADGLSPTSPDMGGLLRPKREEDEMDEDERLLASEEGKKLSSKERRQLRNKVSARAFRSRRKEYIGQLEGEVAVKVQEANDLRAQNRQLMEENTRLTDLTRMLLSSQAFSGFLQELSNSGLPAPNISAAVPASAAPQRSQSRKDVSAHEAARQLQNQNKQAAAAENSDISSNSWNSLPSNDFQVYSVTSLPQPAELDFSALTEKRSGISDAMTKEVPALPTIPLASWPEQTMTESKMDDNVVLDELEFDLYYAASTNSSFANSDVISLISSIAKPESERDDTSKTVEVEESESISGSSDDLQAMCEQLEELATQLEQFLP